jgi:hypothetical protein
MLAWSVVQRSNTSLSTKRNLVRVQSLEMKIGDVRAKGSAEYPQTLILLPDIVDSAMKDLRVSAGNGHL